MKNLYKFILLTIFSMVITGCTAGVNTVIKYMHPILDKHYEMAKDSLKEVSKSKTHTDKTLTFIYPDEKQTQQKLLKSYSKNPSLNKYTKADQIKMAQVNIKNANERLIPTFVKSIQNRGFFTKINIIKDKNQKIAYSDYTISLDKNFWHIKSNQTNKTTILPLVDFNLVDFNKAIEKFYKDNEAYIASKSYKQTPKNHLTQEYIQVRKEYKFKKADKENLDSFALVIGISQYNLNPNVAYADLSALAFSDLLNTTFGIPKTNIITLLNKDATSGQIKTKIALIEELSEKNGNIYIYFAGHGVPDKDGNTYILPADMSADSIYLERNLKLENIYKKLSTANAKNIFIFMDTCFSGKDDKGELLYKGTAPILQTKKMIIPNNKLTVFTAGKSTDFANDIKNKKQRMFSYYLIKELSKGTTNLNKAYSKIRHKVKRESLFKGIGYKQIPQLYGNKKAILY